MGQADVFHELGCIRVIDPEPERFANPPPRLFERAPARVAVADARNARFPGTALVALEDHSVPAAPQPSHFLRHSAARLSLALSSRIIDVGVTAWCYTWPMPTRHRRIPVTSRPALTDAIARVEHHFAGAPAATIVRELAIKGAEAIEREQNDRDQAIERLVDLAARRTDLIDWDVLENVDELAWGD